MHAAINEYVEAVTGKCPIAVMGTNGSSPMHLIIHVLILLSSTQCRYKGLLYI